MVWPTLGSRTAKEQEQNTVNLTVGFRSKAPVENLRNRSSENETNVFEKSAFGF